MKTVFARTLPDRVQAVTLVCATALTLWGATSHAAPPPPTPVLGLSQGETAPTPVCVDTGHARITRLCATVVLRYKIDALLDVPLSNFGLTWSPSSWTFRQLDGSQRTVPHDKLPAPLAQILAGSTLQLKGHALVDFSANVPLQFMPFQTNMAPARDRLGWTAAQRTPQERWLFTPGKCGDGPIQSLDASKAMALYKLGVKSLSVDPRKGAGTCKAQLPVVPLDMAAKTLDKLCWAESNRAASGPLSSLCLPPTAAGLPTRQPEHELLKQRWANELDEGVPSNMTRPSLALLDAATPASNQRTAAATAPSLASN